MFQLLVTKGYEVHYRGTVAVKGKGNMETYFVIGRYDRECVPTPKSSSSSRCLANVVYQMLVARRQHDNEDVHNLNYFQQRKMRKVNESLKLKRIHSVTPTVSRRDTVETSKPALSYPDIQSLQKD